MARPLECSSSERSFPRNELPGMYGRPKASLTTGLSAPPISSEPFPAPMWRPVSQCSSPSRISLPISFNSVFAVCELMLPLLFVVGDDGLKEIPKPLVSTRFVLASNLQQQLFEHIEAAQRVTRDGVSQTCTEHDKL